ncbi:DUF4389 domain-containing protein [Thalassotalea ganghwensis]
MRETLEQELFGEDKKSSKSWKNISIWQRGLAMLLFGFIGGFVRFVITLIAIFQFIAMLLTEQPNKQLQKLGQNLNHYVYHINQFLTANTDTYPFPFSAWPDANISRVPPTNKP